MHTRLMRTRPTMRGGVAFVMTVVAVAGCSGLTSVSAPDVVQRSGLTGLTGAATLFNGAFGSFQQAFGGPNYGGANDVEWTGLIADELTDAGAFPNLDRRVMPDPDPTQQVLYTFMQQAHGNFVDALAAFSATSAPGPNGLRAESYTLMAYTEVFFGELFCAGVPLSSAVNGNIVYGQPLTTDQMFQQALADFDSAVVYGADSVAVLNAARIGRGRVLLDLGRYAEADTAVAGIPTAFSSAIPYSTTLVSSGPYYEFVLNLDVSVGDREGGNGLDFVSASDPRVPTYLSGTSRGGTPIYALSTVTSAATPITLANGIEAQLIHAEAQLAAGNVLGWTGTLNALRADSAETQVRGLPPLTADSTTLASAAMQVDVMFRERAFWLFLTGHRLEDLRRLIRFYGRTQNQVFPTGTWQSGLPYGTDVNYAPPQDAYNNPHYRGCLNRAA